MELRRLNEALQLLKRGTAGEKCYQREPENQSEPHKPLRLQGPFPLRKANSTVRLKSRTLRTSNQKLTRKEPSVTTRVPVADVVATAGRTNAKAPEAPVKVNAVIVIVPLPMDEVAFH